MPTCEFVEWGTIVLIMLDVFKNDSWAMVRVYIILGILQHIMCSSEMGVNVDGAFYIDKTDRFVKRISVGKILVSEFMAIF